MTMISTSQISPCPMVVVATAIPVIPAAAEEEDENDDDQDQRHVLSLSRTSRRAASRLIAQSGAGRAAVVIRPIDPALLHPPRRHAVRDRTIEDR